MGYLDQHKEALLRRAGEEERGLFEMFIWLLNASFASHKRVTADFAEI